MEWAGISPASPRDCEARRSKSRRAAPTQQACDSLVQPVFAVPLIFSFFVSKQTTEDTEALRGIQIKIPLCSSVSSVVDCCSIQKTVSDVGIALDAPITQKWPVAANLVDFSQIYFGTEDLFAIG